jgi:NRPS condensation-like uncharacterized protein
MNISSSAEFMRKLEGSLNGELGNFNDVVISTVNTIILYWNQLHKHLDTEIHVSYTVNMNVS